MVFVRMLSKLLKDPNVGKLIVPIVPDEARTFGMESLFRQVGIYSHVGQRYEPVDKETLLYYKEATDGQILEEGITEAGSISSFIAAGTAHSSHGVNTIPFFIFYSMFGFQRIGDLVWAAGDMRCRGFLLGGTAGRTTLAGEGLQHQDGHSHVLAWTHPHVVAYDPAFAFELAAIIRRGIRRMYVDGEDVSFYLTVGNEPYAMPAMPDGDRDEIEQAILRGAYRFRTVGESGAAPRLRLLGSGAILNEVLAAQAMLHDEWGIASEAWSVTSWQQLYRDAVELARWKRLHPGEARRVAYVEQCFGGDADTVTVAATDYLKVMPYSIRDWIGGELVVLGTDGFGRSEGRASLRDWFEVDARHVAWGTLEALSRRGRIDRDTLERARARLEIDPGKPDASRPEVASWRR
jgi:pyruvate dehydrogenase E1 component